MSCLASGRSRQDVLLRVAQYAISFCRINAPVKKSSSYHQIDNYLSFRARHFPLFTHLFRVFFEDSLRLLKDIPVIFFSRLQINYRDLFIDSSRRDAIIVMYIAEQFQPIIIDCND